ncbi:DUF4402 domain-containing protein [Erythrobacter rubeus]|uniref:DUF4402 domain-containing protein n=1 Tax=Erythrobacter rubeus TaxID=2760803 RepID=A0ABR8KY17_9SPHN|nr:DUF4402 domain-containing protein [Erythrobacter rubeus]MBD2843117.1 DUF4402 domain-containing protein [Erythrobacter rubeus]
MKKLILLAAASAVVSAPAMAAPGDTSTAQGSATAEVVAPITLTHVTNAALDFGTFTTGDNGGTVVVDLAGDGTDSGDVTLIGGSAEAADAFTVAGDASRSFSITTSAGSVGNGTDTMNFTTNAPTDGTLNGSGAAAFSVGGTLTVAGGESAGVYTGTYDVTVAYN